MSSAVHDRDSASERSSSVRSARTKVLGLLVCDIRNPFFSEVAHAAERAAMRLGYTVLLATANEDATKVDEYLRIFASQRIDGLLLAAQGPASPQLVSLLRAGLGPVVRRPRVV